MSELRSLLDQLAALDVADLDPAELTGTDLLDGIPVLQAGLRAVRRTRPDRPCTDRPRAGSRSSSADRRRERCVTAVAWRV